jgi:Asp-tRNA(Asn)/Glu-tRNA(Gln) amidotransferase A subunit family amidase
MARRARDEFAVIAEVFDAIMAPSAPGEAPDIASTGDPVFNRMWTLLGVPAITLPYTLGEQGLPLGIQFLGRFDSDYALLEFCKYVEAITGKQCSLADATRQDFSV